MANAIIEGRQGESFAPQSEEAETTETAEETVEAEEPTTMEEVVASAE